MIVLESDREWDIISFGFMHFKQQTTMKVRERDAAHSPPSTNPFIHPFSYIWVLISGVTGACLESPWDQIHFPSYFRGLSLWKWHLSFKSGMFYCISFRSIIDCDQTRFQLSNITPKVSRSRTFCKKYQITGTSQNSQAFKTPWRVQHILRGWDLPAESLTFDWKLAGARFSSQYFPITSTSWESGDVPVSASMPSHSFSVFCDQTNMCERLISVVIQLMLNNNSQQRTP